MRAGLFTTARQQRLLRGIAARATAGLERYAQVRGEHVRAAAELARRQASDVESLDRRSAEARRAMLAGLDRDDERATAAYEQKTLATRQDLRALQREIRQQRRAGRKAIAARCAAAYETVVQRYEAVKREPIEWRAKQKERLNAAWRPLAQHLEDAREIALRRSGALIEPPRETSSLGDDASVDAVVGALEQVAREAATQLQALRTGGPARILETFRFPLLMAAVLGVWTVAVLALGLQPPVLWLLGGLLVAAGAGGGVYIALLPAIRRHTAHRYPKIEQAAAMGRALVSQGNQLAAEAATAWARRLKQERDEAIRQAAAQRDAQREELEAGLDRQLAEQTDRLRRRLHGLDGTYRERIAGIESRLADQLRQWEIQQTTERTHTLEQQARQRDALARRHHQEDDAQAARIRGGLARALQRVRAAERQVHERFPDWQAILSEASAPSIPLGMVPVGELRIAPYLRRQLAARANAPIDLARALPEPLPEHLPVVALAGRDAGVLIDCPSRHADAVRQVVQGILMRLLAAVPPGKLRLLMLDPAGRGQSFASLMQLADYDPALVGHRAWTQASQIETRLGELTQHMEDILQTYLRDQYATIDHYNAGAGAMAEPYRVVAAMGVPTAFSPAAMEHLSALLDSGPRCGIFTLLVRDPDAPWPRELPRLPEDRLLKIRVDAEGGWHHGGELLSELRLQPIAPPPAEIQAELLERIGRAAADSRRVEIPFDSVVGPREAVAADSAEGLDVPLGRQGAGRRLWMRLGEGVRQHVLVAGKTGSGKSSLLHSLIMASALRYSPDQLEMYLLDFKKGVEFKPYADHHLPHARVVGIESEREFGRSVLERIDLELQRRGELFRAAAVQELAEYRQRCSEPLPRVLLVIDEFQELFVRDDRVAQDCTMLLDRLVRQGRSFGIHVVLSSQSLSGAYSLPRNTLGQMAVRIALQSSEADALAILGEDNTAARLLSRPGEAIYNDAGGLVEGNQPFQVAWLAGSRQLEWLEELAQRHAESAAEREPMVIFEGNRPARWKAAAADAAHRAAAAHPAAILGEAVSLRPPVTVPVGPDPGRNLLVASSQTELVDDLLAMLIPTLVADSSAQGRPMRVEYLAGRRGEHALAIPEFLEAAGIMVRHGRPRDAESVLVRLSELVQKRTAEEELAEAESVLLVIDPLERFRDLRQDDSFGFSLDAQRPAGPAALATLLRDGPAVGVHTLVCCGGAEALARWLPRSSHHDLEIRILGRLSMSDSTQLIDSGEAAALSPAAMVLYDDALGSLDKFRVFARPEPAALRRWVQGRQPPVTRRAEPTP